SGQEPETQRTDVDQETHRQPQAPLPRERLSPATLSRRSCRAAAMTEAGQLETSIRIVASAQKLSSPERMTVMRQAGRVGTRPMSAVEVDLDVARKQTSVTALYVVSRQASEHISATRSKVVGC
ncbi:hypothetical protein, partial [Sinorhizobium terangae]|uniref:hypothetical protein n=1 Tax=Sinorhizobium terangae TaxID=110322 RepID=UPI001AED5B8F